jgi:hypothetical protein
LSELTESREENRQRAKAWYKDEDGSSSSRVHRQKPSYSKARSSKPYSKFNGSSLAQDISYLDEESSGNTKLSRPFKSSAIDRKPFKAPSFVKQP